MRETALLLIKQVGGEGKLRSTFTASLAFIVKGKKQEAGLHISLIATCSI